MTATTEIARRPSRAQQGVGLAALVLAVGLIVLAGWSATQRLADVATGHDVPVELRLNHEQARAVLGFDRGAAFEGDISVNSITIPVEDPSPAALRALWAQPIARFLSIAAGACVAALFLVRIARPRPERGAAALAFVGAVIVAADWAVQAVLGRIASADVRALAFDASLEAALPPVDLAPLGWILFLIALGGALRTAERLRRETEGLI